MDDAERVRLGATFDTAAELYDRARPGFADAAVDWVLPPGARRVLDLGAGTGKLTASLMARGLDIVAVDRSPNMLARLRANLPGVRTMIGTAEATGLPAASVDAIVVGSAFHWFARPQAEEEMARVLVPGGRVGLFWNRRDPAAATTRAFDEARRRGGNRNGESHADVELDRRYFGPTERRDFPHHQRVTPEQFVELVASRSYVIDMAEPDRGELLERVRTFTRTDPAVAGRDVFDLAYLTLARRADALGG